VLKLGPVTPKEAVKDHNELATPEAVPQVAQTDALVAEQRVAPWGRRPDAKIDRQR
jgi:hypothetical protein